MATGDCQLCKQPTGLYDLNCEGCRERALIDEPCKLLRQQLAERMQYKRMTVPNWMREPSCGCKGQCKRMRNIKTEKYDANTPYRQGLVLGKQRTF